MARCTKEEALETRERLLDAALEVFHAEGVSRPSLSKVAELAGATRGAVYGHFENKADLFAALCDRILLPAEALAEVRGRSLDDPLGALHSWCLWVLTDPLTNVQKRRLLEVILHRCEMVDDNGEIRERRLKARATGATHVRELVALAVQRGQLAADLDVDVAAGLFHDSVVGVLSQWLLGPEAFDLRSRAPQYADALVDMLRTSRALRRA